MSTLDRLSGLSASLGRKAPVRVATTANVILSGLYTLDGVVLEAADRVLVKNQTAGAENGIYLASSGDWVRTKDFNKLGDATRGTSVVVASGVTNALKEF